ncbi:MAG TPA: hypothetical protein VE398_00845 [Acidobacteriota bacterium]|nr:hypothetical protein [Acidobacteriota bacterium]
MNDHIDERDIALLASGDIEAKPVEHERHLIECAVCAGLLEKYRQDRLSMKTPLTDDIPENEYASMRASVLAKLDGPARRVPSFFGAPLRWAALAAAVVIIAALGVWWTWQSYTMRGSVMPAPNQLVVRPTSVKPFLSVTGPIPQEAPNQSKASAHTKPPGRRIERAHERPAVLDDVAIKMETADPNVIVIWLVSPKGE